MGPRSWTLLLSVAALMSNPACDRRKPSMPLAPPGSASVSAKTTSTLGSKENSELGGPKVPRLQYSMIELLANPSRFQGADVGVVGYLVMDRVHEDEDDGTLFLERESARMNLTPNALSVRFGPCRTRLAVEKRMLQLGTDPMPALPGYVMVRGILEPPPEEDPFGVATICAVSSVLGLEDPQQGSGAKSWWNSVGRPGPSATPPQRRPPRP